MTDVILTFKLMGASPDVDFDKIKEEATKLITEFDAELGKSEIEPIAFGLKALLLYVVRDEKKGSADALEDQLGKIEGVQSATTIDVRRAIG